MAEAVSRLNAALEGLYSIERELGEGGMATVYLAEDLKHHRKIALKVLKPELTAVVGADASSLIFRSRPTSSIRTFCRCTTPVKRMGSCSM